MDMILTSLSFAVFFFIIFIFYWQITKKYQWLFLLAASYYFYFSWKPVYGIFLLFTTLITFLFANKIQQLKSHNKTWLFFALLLIISQLFVFKYYNLFSLTTVDLLAKIGWSIKLPQFSLLLPLGISFFSFQSIGYLVDVYRGKTKAEKNIGKLALFLSFFPNITAGPIERGWHLIPQFTVKHNFSYQQVVSGLKLFGWGLFKKLVIADNIGLVVTNVFENLSEYKGLSLVITMFLFSLQILADFSGYTDMARGIARMLGYSLLENFKTPYFSTSVRDFWRRWHISLSSWFRDYLYIPLGGSRKGELRTYVNTVIVFVLCGLWHGAAWNFILWGFIHGVFLSLERIMSMLFHKKIHVKATLSIVYSFVVITSLWVLFRAASIADAWYIYRYSLVGIKYFFSPAYWWATLSQLFNTNVVEMIIVLFCVLVFGLSELIAYKSSLTHFVKRLHPIMRWAIYVALVASIILLRNTKAYEFIYVQF